MEADGTIVLQLRTESPSGAIGDVPFRYPPGHRDYQEVLRHPWGLKKGRKNQFFPGRTRIEEEMPEKENEGRKGKWRKLLVPI